MALVSFNCRKCGKKTQGLLLNEWDYTLPPGLKVVECQEPKKNGICAAVGVELIPDTPIVDNHA
jgi:hypothetical protein